MLLGVRVSGKGQLLMYGARVFVPPLTATDGLAVRVTLQHVEPAIWRMLHIPAQLLLADLHHVIQIAFGWKDCHLHDFFVRGTRFGVINLEEFELLVDELGAPLGAVARVGDELTYRYDFGDDWEHKLTIESAIANAGDTILCTGGARACPPEDCGGPFGYANLLRVLADPKDEEHQELKRWVGKRFAPERFELDPVNKRLATLLRQLRRRR